MRTHILIASVCLALTACGGSEPAPEATEAPEPSAGDEIIAAEPEPEAPPEPEPAPVSGPASVTVTATVNRQPVAAHVRLVGADGATAAEGDAGQKLSVPSGEYTLEVAVTDATALVDKPTETRDLTLAAGADATEAVDFAFAKIKLNVKINGAFEPKAVVRVLRKGALVAEIPSGGDYVMISPGRYGAEVKARGAIIEIDELMFPQGATREMPVSVAIP